MSRIVKLADFAHVSLATAAKTVLEESGIRCFLQSDVLSESMFTRNAGFGSARLLVAEEDLDAAQQLLASLREQTDDDATSWFCTACQEEIEAGFAACWSCGRARDEVGGERPTRPPQDATSVDFTDPERPAEWPLELVNSLNPYASPRTSPEAEPEHDATAESEQETVLSVADDLALRAYRAAVFGFLLFPCLPVLHGYAAWLVWQCSHVEPPATPRGQRYATLATAIISLVGLPLIGALFWQVFG